MRSLIATRLSLAPHSDRIFPIKSCVQGLFLGILFMESEIILPIWRSISIGRAASLVSFLSNKTAPPASGDTMMAYFLTLRSIEASAEPYYLLLFRSRILQMANAKSPITTSKPNSVPSLPSVFPISQPPSETAVPPSRRVHLSSGITVTTGAVTHLLTSWRPLL